MEINDKLLEKLSQLSALCFSDKEKKEIQNYLRETLSHFEKIKKIDTQDTKPLISPLKPPLMTRADKSLEYSDREKMLNQVPQRQGSLVKVPPIV